MGIILSWDMSPHTLIYCNVAGQSGVFTVPCRAEPSRAGPSRAGPGRAEPGRAEPGRAGPGRGVLVATQSCGKHLSAALPWWRLNKS
jgi:hypothetical protein